MQITKFDITASIFSVGVTSHDSDLPYKPTGKH